MRIYIAWFVGIGLFLLTLILTDLLAKFIGFTTYIDYGETITVTRNRYYDEEVSGHTTSIGIFFMFLSYAIAIRGGMAVNSGKINGNISKKGNFQLLIIGCALLLYGLVGHLIFFIFDLSGFLANLTDLGLGIGIAYLCYNYYQKRAEGFDNKKKTK
tara:strand:+ start:130 stop:600 length:471 start_codon:yes stop_codon:yes gene_type:complete